MLNEANETNLLRKVAADGELLLRNQSVVELQLTVQKNLPEVFERGPTEQTHCTPK